MALGTSRPDAIIASTNFSDVVLANITDDPDAPDAAFITQTSNGTASSIEIGFSQAVHNTTRVNTQNVRIYARKKGGSNAIAFTGKIYDPTNNTTFHTIPSTAVANTTGEVINISWTPAVSETSANFRVVLDIAAQSGKAANMSGIDFGAIEFNYETEEPLTVAPVLSGTSTQPDIIALSWDKPVGAHHFDVQEQDAAGAWTNVAIDLTGTSYNHTGLTEGTTKTHRVIAFNSNESQSTISNSVTTTTPKPKDTSDPWNAHEMTTKRINESGKNKKLNEAWEDIRPNPAAWAIWRPSAGQNGITVAVGVKGTGTTTDTYLTLWTGPAEKADITAEGSSTGNMVEVITWDDTGNGIVLDGTTLDANSAYGTFVVDSAKTYYFQAGFFADSVLDPFDILVDTIAAGTPPATTLSNPARLKVVSQADTSIGLSWRPPGGAHHYTVQFNLDGGTTWTNAATGVTDTDYTHTGLTAATYYYYRIVTYNSDETISTISDVVKTNTTTTGAPKPPTNLAATALASRVNLTWSESATATSYVVVRDTVVLGEVKELTYSDATAVADTAYSYTVRARNANATSADSTAISSTPYAGKTVRPDALNSQTTSNAVFKGTTVSAADTFDRPNNVDPNPASDGGTWTIINGGDWDIVSNRADCIAHGTGPVSIMARDMGTPDIDVELRLFAGQGTYDGIGLCSNADSSNFTEVSPNGVWTFTAGTWAQNTAFPTFTPDGTNGSVIRAVKSGDTLVMYLNGVEHGRATDTGFAKGTWHGLLSETNVSTYDDYKCSGTSAVADTTIAPLTAVTDNDNGTFLRMSNAGATASEIFADFSLPDIADIDLTNGHLEILTNGAATIVNPTVAIHGDTGSVSQTITLPSAIGSSHTFIRGADLGVISGWTNPRIRYSFTNSSETKIDIAEISVVYRVGAAAPAGHGQLVGIPL